MNASKNLKNTQEKSIIEKWFLVEKKLKDVYFFTQQQINAVFDLHYDEPDIVDHVIDETIREYPHLPSEMLINEYLYQTLMGMEDIQTEVIDK